MFYSHEILTSRKYGVATIWLVATIGSKSSHRKVTRKDILKVNVSKVCDTLIEPEAPMALRLQSNLLYGISRVYSQQWSYVLVDAQTAQNAIRQLLKTVRTNELDAVPTKTRPENLILSDDPTFLPDVAFGQYKLDLSNLQDSTFEVSQSSFLSPRTHGSSQSINSLLPDIIIPTSASTGAEDGGAQIRFKTVSDMFGQQSEGEGFLPDIDFDIDADTTFHGNQGGSESGDQPVHFRDTTRSDNSLMEQVRREHEANGAVFSGANNYGEYAMDFNSDIANIDVQLPMNAEPFSPRVEGHGHQDSTFQNFGVNMERRAEKIKFLKPDYQTELRSSDLTAWRNEYLETMAQVVKSKLYNKAQRLAKSNVAYWTWGSGIGGVGAIIDRMPGKDHPLDMFRGNKLIHSIIGHDIIDKKRVHEEADEYEFENEYREQHARGTSAEREFGRGLNDTNTYDDFVALRDEEPPETGRAAPTPLAGDLSQDISAVMPWNISAQRSSVVARTRGARLHSASSTPLPGRFHTESRGSRLGTTSPALRRSQLPLTLEDAPNSDLHPLAGYGDDEFDLPQNFSIVEGLSGSDYSPEPRLETQGTTNFRDTLDFDSINFLDFVESAIASRKRLDTVSESGGIAFGEVLPLASTSRVIAAQGFLHLLTLATRELLTIVQNEAFGDIILMPNSFSA